MRRSSMGMSRSDHTSETSQDDDDDEHDDQADIGFMTVNVHVHNNDDEATYCTKKMHHNETLQPDVRT